jgi:hypothetical protein
LYGVTYIGVAGAIGHSHCRPVEILCKSTAQRVAGGQT